MYNCKNCGILLSTTSPTTKQWNGAYYCNEECMTRAIQATPLPVEKKPQGDRYNTGKPRTDLIPAEVLLKLAEHYEYGARKYAPNNWASGLSYSETAGSLLRHLYAWQSGENIDEESGQHHLVPVIWNAITLMFFELHPEIYGTFDDRLSKLLESMRPSEVTNEKGEKGITLESWLAPEPLSDNPFPPFDKMEGT